MTIHTTSERNRDNIIDRIGALESAPAGGPTLTVEDVQDTVGAMATDTTSIDFTYNDAAATLTADVKLAAITAAFAGQYRLLNVRVINQGTVSYTPTSGTTALLIVAIAAGGGGGAGATAATNNAGAGGGGGGALSIKWATSFTAGAITVQAGAKGTGGAAGANNGNDGTDSTFDSPSICTAKGGKGGVASTVGVPVASLKSAGGVGGAAASGVGTVLFNGVPGGYGIGETASTANGGRGAAGPFGGGVLETKNQGAGANGLGWGSGGGGACIVAGGVSVAGGDGVDGVILVLEFQA